MRGQLNECYNRSDFNFTILIVSLLITVDTVFRILKQWVPHYVSQFFVISFLYFVYLYLLLALSTYLLGEIIYEYTLVFVIAYYFFKRMGAILLVMPPFFILFTVEISTLLIDTPKKNILLIGIIQILLYLFVNQMRIRKKKGVFALLFAFATIVSIQFSLNDIQALQAQTTADIRLLALLGSLVIVIFFEIYYNVREREVKKHQEAILQSKRDVLTDTYNYNALNEAVESLKVESKKVVIAMVDVDWFKKLNDEHGHLVGNIILKQFIYLMRKHLLSKISHSQFEIYRFGGEEFCLFFYELSQKEVFQLLDEFRKSLANEGLFINEELTIHLSFSAGIEGHDDYEKDLFTTIAKADAACYYSKKIGRGIITLSQDI